MAKKSMKKFVALLLSVIMIATSFPMAIFTAFADDNDTLVTNAEDALNAFVVKMDGHTYANMTNAYNKYVKLSEVLDVYKYTGTDKGLASATSDLTSVTNSLSAVQKKTTNKIGSFKKDNNRISADDYAGVYKNLLYAPTGHETVAGQSDKTTIFEKSGNGGGGTQATVYIYLPNTVMMYDGVTTPQTAMMLRSEGSYWRNAWSTWNAKALRDYGADMISSSANGLDLADEFHGYDTSTNFMWTWYDANKCKLPRTPTGDFWSHNNDTNRYYSNILMYTGSFPEGVYYKKINPTFQMSFGGDITVVDTGKGTDGTVKVNATANNSSIYVLNYKAIFDTQEKYKEKITLAGKDGTYKHGGMATIFTLFDNASVIDPTTQDYSNPESGTIAVANKIKDACDKIANASVVAADSKGYDNLGKALLDSKTNFEAGKDDPDIASNYPEGAWDDFVASYNKAMDVFNKLIDTGYNNETAAQSLAEELNENRGKLVAVNKVDASALMVAIKNAQAVIDAKKYFTADSYTASDVVAVTNAAKEAVWGSVANYGVEAKLLSDNDANKAIVVAQVNALKASLAKLAINPEATTAATGVSMNQAIAMAMPYLPKTEDYANLNVLREAVEDAQAFIAGDTFVDATIADHSHFRIETYAKKVNAIVLAINTLAIAFSKVTDGTMAHSGQMSSTTIDSSHNPGYWQLTYAFPSGVTFFRTEHKSSTYELPTASFTFRTNCGYDALLDSINVMADENLANNEITSISSSNAFSDNATGWALNAGQCEEYHGLLEFQSGGLTFKFDNMKVSGQNQNGSSQIGKAADGSNINADQIGIYDFTELLAVTDGKEPIAGGVTAKKGDNAYGAITVSARTTVTTEAHTAEQQELFLYDNIYDDNFNIIGQELIGLNGGISISELDTEKTQSYIGMVYEWGYHPFNIWHGYSYDRERYNQKVYVVDITKLLDMIKFVETLNSADYSNASWKNLQTALTAAKSEIKYDNYDSYGLMTLCQDRLDNLYDAWTALETPANNLAIKNILDEVQNVYRNDESICVAETWAPFAQAYMNLYTLYMNDYSDKNVRDYGVSDQEWIDALANPLKEAYANLVHVADFTVFDGILEQLGTKISLLEDVHTEAQIRALEAMVADSSVFPLFNVYQTALATGDMEPLKSYYDTTNPNYTNDQVDIVAEKEAILDLTDTLTKPDIDTSVFEAAIAELNAKYKDKDAWDGVGAAIVGIYNLAGNNYYKDSTAFGVPVKVYTYDTIEGYDQAITELLTEDRYQIKPKKYTVNYNGNSLTVDYGTKVFVDAAGVITTDEDAINKDLASVDWYYSYKSVTTSNTEKFISSDSYIAFIVKGDTTLRTTSSATEGNKVRVNYVNSLNGKTIKIDYVDAGTAITLDVNTANFEQSFIGYKLDHFTAKVNGATQTVESVVAEQDMTIVANYVYDDQSEKYTVTFANLGTTFASLPVTITDLAWNDLITMKDANIISGVDASTTKTNISLVSDTAKYNNALIENGNLETTITKRNIKLNANNAIQKWAVINADYEEEWLTYLADKSKNNTITKLMATKPDNIVDSIRILSENEILNYRVHSNVIIMPLSINDVNAITGAYYSGMDEQGVTLTTSKKLAVGTDKVSIISSYSLPEGATAIEAGVLFASYGDSRTPGFDMNDMNCVNAEETQDGKTIRVARMKSTQHTAGNQFVISIGTTKLAGKGAVTMKYAAYIIYDLDGTMYTTFTDAVVDTVDFD